MYLNSSYRAFGQNYSNKYSDQLNQSVNTNSNPTFKNITVNECWDDLQVGASTFSVGASIRAPAVTKFADLAAPNNSGVYGYGFEDGKEQDVMVSCQLSHRYKIGSIIKPHIHLSVPTFSAGKYLKFTLEYFTVAIGSAYTNSQLITSSPLVCPTALTHVILPLPDIPGTGLGISSIFYGRLTRDIVAVNSYTGVVNILGFDLHCQYDNMGSHSEYVK